MGEVVSLAGYKAKHHPGYIRGCILDNWLMWSNGQTPSTSGWSKPEAHARDSWTKEESDKKVAEARKRSNARVKAKYRVGSKRNG
jgi:hypothetical protein